MELDPLELELRLLPGVIAVGLEGDEEALRIYLVVSPENRMSEVRKRAGDITKSHLDGPAAIEIRGVREPGPSGVAAAYDARAGERVAVLAVRVADGGEVEVHLGFAGARTVGRGTAGSGKGAVEATLEALEGLGVPLAFDVRALATLSLASSQVTVVALRPAGGSRDRMGVAGAATVDEAACRATLSALNRYLEAPEPVGQAVGAS